jgi:hypothetical protein
MGLDIIELVMNIEETFGVVIPDDQAERMKTLGDTHRVLLLKTGLRPDPPCLSGVTFYRVRRALLQLGVPRQGVRPRAGLGELLPGKNRRVLWERFRQALGPLRLPALTRPGWIFAVSAAVALATAATAALALHGRPDGPPWYIALVSGELALAALIYRLSEPLAVCFPGGCVTVRDVVLDVLEHNRDAIAVEVARREGSISPEREREVWDTLCRLVSEWSGVDPKLLTESTSWSDELGGS